MYVANPHSFSPGQAIASTNDGTGDGHGVLVGAQSEADESNGHDGGRQDSSALAATLVHELPREWEHDGIKE